MYVPLPSRISIARSWSVQDLHRHGLLPARRRMAILPSHRLAIQPQRQPLAGYVDAGISTRFFISDEDGKRYSSYRKMIKATGRNGSKLKWKWVDMPLDEYDACTKEINAGRAEALPIMSLD